MIATGKVPVVMAFVDDKKPEMSAEAQTIFRDLERLGLDWRNRGRSGRGGAR